jgi:hypothetical protein
VALAEGPVTSVTTKEFIEEVRKRLEEKMQ